ncbi:MAG: cyanophycin synthetase [Endomicrobiia bacterium]
MNVFEYLSQISKKEYLKKNYTLHNIKKALKLLGSPHKEIKNIIHITGTNGKGSVAIFTSRMLNILGYTTGLFISPHIFDVTERIQYNNKPIEKKIFKKYLFEIYNTLPSNLFFELTYFELISCVMFLFFREKKPDFVVLEVGLGGKLDATNVIEKSVISCITSISLDHTEVLGNTEFLILKDKSQIIRPGSIFICGKVKKRLRDYLKRLCKKINTKFVFCKKSFEKINFNVDRWTTEVRYFIEKNFYKAVFSVCSLTHPYNFNIALEIINQLYKAKLIKKPEYKKVFEKIPKVIIPFRMQRFKINGCEIIVDGAHNPASVDSFVKLIKKLSIKNFVICFTIMKDKDYRKIIKILSNLKNKIYKFIVYKINNPRVENLDILYKNVCKYFNNKKVVKISKPENLLKYLKNFCIKKKIFFIGSFYIFSVFKNKIRWKKFLM